MMTAASVFVKKARNIIFNMGGSMTSDNLPLKELAHPGYSQEECEMVVQ